MQKYIFYIVDDSWYFILDDWRCDGCRWYQYGSKFIPRKEPLFKKIHFGTAIPNGYNRDFRRQAYIPLRGETNVVLIHYLGDEKFKEDRPHGNSKAETTRNFTRTCPSVLKKLTSTDDLPSNVYKREVAKNDCLPELQSVLIPRNSKQVANTQYQQRQKYRLSHDALYNVHELAYDMDGYVISMTTYPDLMIVCGLKELAHELNLLLEFVSEKPQLLSYDTTFQLGDFYVSPLLFRHTLFTTSPVLPVLFLIHERKYHKVHDKFFECFADLVPNLNKEKHPIPLVTDEEVRINQVSNMMYILFYFHKFFRLLISSYQRLQGYGAGIIQ